MPRHSASSPSMNSVPPGAPTISPTVARIRQVAPANVARKTHFSHMSSRMVELALASSTILLDMWEKWVFLATLAGATCLMRATVGEIVGAPGGTEFMLGLLAECRGIAQQEGFPPREAFLANVRRMLTAPHSTLTASMLRDLEQNAPVEADHVIGDLLRRGKDLTILPIVYAHLKAYEQHRFPQ